MHWTIPKSSFILFISCVVGMLLASSSLMARNQKQSATKKLTWNLDKELAALQVADGFYGPVGITFLNNPGPRPADPLFLVSELRGPIKAVSRVGMVYEVGMFGDAFRPLKELPDIDGEGGQTGICIDNDDKKLFTTSAILDGNNRINAINLWESSGPRPWQNIHKIKTLTEPFIRDRAGAAHQIGHCFIDDQDTLWVGVGDGFQYEKSHLPEHSSGKLLRLNLDFSGHVDNPFYDPNAPFSTQSLVYAMGLRNPFGIGKAPGGSVYIADNGPQVDRLIEVIRGHDYPWDNTDASMTFDNLLTWARPIGPSGLVYVPEDHPGLKSLGHHVLVSGSHNATIFAIPVTPGQGVTGKPRPILSPQKGSPRHSISGLTLGPDGLYVSLINMEGKNELPPSPILKVTSKQLAERDRSRNGALLVEKMQCQSCHLVGLTGSTKAPPLNGLRARFAELMEAEDVRRHLITRLSDASTDTSASFKEALQDPYRHPAGLTHAWIIAKLTVPALGHPDVKAAQLTPEQMQRLSAHISNLPAIRGEQPSLDDALYRLSWYLNQKWKAVAWSALLLGGCFGYWGALRRGKTRASL